MISENAKIQLKQQIDEAIEEAKRREINAKNINPYRRSVYTLSEMKKDIDNIDMPKTERKQNSVSFAMFIIHMLEPADMEFSNHLAKIGTAYDRLFDLIDPDVQKIIFDEFDDDDDFDDDEDDDDDDI